MKTKLLFYLLMFCLLVACSKSGSSSNNPGNSSSTNYAPPNIYNKTFDDDGTEKIYGFTSSGTCSLNSNYILGTIVGTPTYSYTRKNSTTANFSWHYNEKDPGALNMDNSTSVTLTFKNETAGRYTGSLIMKATGSTTSTRTTSVSGSFTLQ